MRRTLRDTSFIGIEAAFNSAITKAKDILESRPNIFEVSEEPLRDYYDLIDFLKIFTEEDKEMSTEDKLKILDDLEDYTDWDMPICGYIHESIGAAIDRNELDTNILALLEEIFPEANFIIQEIGWNAANEESVDEWTYYSDIYNGSENKIHVYELREKAKDELLKLKDKLE